MTVLVPLPIFVLGGWIAVAAARLGWRDGVLVGFLFWLTGWELSAAALSRMGQFNFTGVLASQVVQLAAQALVLARRPPPTPVLGRSWRNPWVIVLTAEALVLLLLAASVAPTNFDSMAYHLPKVAQWLQAERVGSFPAEYAPQVYLPFLGEIGMAQFSVLTGAAWAVNLVQYCAHVVGVTAVSVLARNVGVDNRGQAIAAGVFGLSPLVVSQAVTTQTDYVMCTIVVIAYAMALGRPRRVSWLVLVALASGLAVAVKPTAVLMVLPAAVLSLRHLQGVRPRRAALPLVASILIGVGVNVWWMAINHDTWGSISGVESSLTNDTDSLDTVASNLVRNLTLHAAVPDAGTNAKMETGVRTLLGKVGIDADAPATTLGSYVVGSERNEDRAANPLQVVLIAAALVAVLVGGRGRRALWPIAVSLLLVCTATAGVLRWQPWGGRFLLTAIALGAVLVGAALSRWPRWVVGVTLCVLTAQSLPYLLDQDLRPLVGERSVLATTAEEELFFGRPDLAGPYQGIADSIIDQDDPRIGLADGMYLWEYPLWWLLQRSNPAVTIGNARPCPQTLTEEPAEWDRVMTWREVSGEEYVAPEVCAH